MLPQTVPLAVGWRLFAGILSAQSIFSARNPYQRVIRDRNPAASHHDRRSRFEYPSERVFIQIVQ